MTNVTIPAQVLKTAASFVTRDQLRPAMTNVQVWNRPGLGLHVTATDAHVLYSWKSAPLPFEFQFLIEGLRPKEKREDFRFQIEPGGLPVAESGGILNHGQAVAAANSTKKPYKGPVAHNSHTYPDWPAVVPEKGGEKEWIAGCANLRDTIERIRRCANETSNQLTFDFKNEVITAADLDYNIEARASLPFKSLDDDIQKMAFCAPKFLQALSPFDKRWPVKISIWRPNWGVIVNGEPGGKVPGESFVLLMPVRLSE